MDRIDLELLSLLRQRTKLSGKIGEAKRRHGAVVYVPQREHELLDRVVRLGRRHLPAEAVRAIYREILSGSRGAQHQPGVGLLEADVERLTIPARACLGACDRLVPHASWPAMARGLRSGKLAMALLGEGDLIGLLNHPAERHGFLAHCTVAGEFSLPPARSKLSLQVETRAYIVIPQGLSPLEQIDRMLILMKCKDMKKAVTTWLGAMSDSLISVAAYPLKTGDRLVHLEFTSPGKTAFIVKHLQEGPVDTAILGAYTSGNHGG